MPAAIILALLCLLIATEPPLGDRDCDGRVRF